jgi:hypothetical protein
LFGEDGTKEVTPEEKTKRLVEESRAAFEAHIEDTIRARFPALPQKFSDSLTEAYVKQTVAEISAELVELAEQLRRERAARQAPFDVNAGIINAAVKLAEQTNRVASDLDLLAEAEMARFAAAEKPAALPVAEEYLLQVGMLPMVS